MAGLAADADLGEGGGETIGCCIVILAHAGRVALRAHEIPVLVQLGPMQGVVVLDLLVRIEMKPALSALFLRPAVPGDRQCLQSAIREFDQVLLQRIDPEGVFHREGGQLSVRAVGLDQELAGLPEKPRAYAVIIEARVVEIAEHRLVVRVLHRLLVLGRTPKLRLRLMTARAGLAADVCRDRRGIRMRLAEERHDGCWPPDGQGARQNSQACQCPGDHDSLRPALRLGVLGRSIRAASSSCFPRRSYCRSAGWTRFAPLARQRWVFPDLSSAANAGSLIGANLSCNRQSLSCHARFKRASSNPGAAG